MTIFQNIFSTTCWQVLQQQYNCTICFQQICLYYLNYTDQKQWFNGIDVFGHRKVFSLLPFLKMLLRIWSDLDPNATLSLFPPPFWSSVLNFTTSREFKNIFLFTIENRKTVENNIKNTKTTLASSCKHASWRKYHQEKLGKQQLITREIQP